MIQQHMYMYYNTHTLLVLYCVDQGRMFNNEY